MGIVRDKFTQALANNMIDKDWSSVSDIVRQRSGLTHDDKTTASDEIE